MSKDNINYVKDRERTRKVLGKILAITLIVIVAVILLTGCDTSTDYDSKAQPTVKSFAEYNGCKIEKLGFPQFSDYVYLARCDSITTTTAIVRSGKTSKSIVMIDQQIEDLQKQKAEEELKQAALNKLSDEEKRLLLGTH